ncbi:MAG: Plug domain-containing protein, partial [Planctomycetota bacterium]
MGARLSRDSAVNRALPGAAHRWKRKAAQFQDAVRRYAFVRSPPGRPEMERAATLSPLLLRTRIAACAAAFAVVCGGLARAQAPESRPAKDLDDLSLEDLLSMEVSIATRHDEKMSDTAAAVYVITGDELRRSGHKSLQDALRMVPGFHVNNWKTSGWDVTSRGFTGSLSAVNESFANQLLLVIDGVDVYNPIMAGIWWPLADVPLQDVDRIEILRGPAGTLWGANAMNGVVHVITKHARDTLGESTDVDMGNKIQSGDLSVGRPIGDNGWILLPMST